MELPARFPEGTLFLRVQHRVPVTIERGVVAAWDNPTSPSPRPFSPRTAMEHGVPISESEFRALVVKSRADAVAFKKRSDELVAAMVQNLRAKTLAQAEHDAQLEVVAWRIAAEAIRRAQYRAKYRVKWK
jgi:hypothetical protein